MFGVTEVVPNYDFYFACLDRMDLLLTEKGSTLGKPEVLEIVRRLSYFRPKEAHTSGQVSKAMGEFTKKDNQNDVISTRHKEIIRSQNDKAVPMPLHAANFLYQNLTKGLLKGFFKDWDAEQESKFSVGSLEVLQMYI